MGGPIVLTVVAFLLSFALAGFGQSTLAVVVAVAGVLLVEPVHLAGRYLLARALLPVVLWTDRMTDRIVERATERAATRQDQAADVVAERVPLPRVPARIPSRTPWGTLPRRVAA